MAKVTAEYGHGHGHGHGHEIATDRDMVTGMDTDKD
jgi:hypothetical protein